MESIHAKALLIIVVPVYGALACGNDDPIVPTMEQPPQFQSQWGNEIGSAGRLFQPLDTDIGRDGQVYVIDGGHRLVQIYTQDGEHVTNWEADINLFCIDSAGMICASAGLHGVFVRYTPDGVFVDSWPYVNVYGLAGDEEGHVLISGSFRDDRFNPPLLIGPYVWKLDEEGTVIEKWTHMGLGRLALDPEGSIILIENYHDSEGFPRSTMEKFRSDGSFVTKAAIGGPERASFWDVESDQQGNIYATNWVDNYVYKFDSEGNVLLKWRDFNSQLEPFSQPAGIAIDSQNQIYITDWHNRMLIFSP